MHKRKTRTVTANQYLISQAFQGGTELTREKRWRSVSVWQKMPLNNRMKILSQCEGAAYSMAVRMTPSDGVHAR
jgi:hypothetical protein